MIRSMTGYGRAESVDSGRSVSVEIKSVNHRYFEFSSRIPRVMNFLEDRIKNFVQSKVSRGKIELYLSVDQTQNTDVTVTANKPLAEQYVKAYRELAESLCIDNDTTVSDLARNADIFSVKKAEEDEEKLWLEIEPVLEAAVEAFIRMREREGEKLKEDVLSRLAFIGDAVEKIEKRSPETVKEHREKTELRIRELLSDAKVDEQRLLTEAAIFADRVAVDEETVRLKSHLAQIRKMLVSTESVGRKLDFMIQETNREINTVGSKAQDVEMAHIVVDVKAELEKIREQIQNIE